MKIDGWRFVYCQLQAVWITRTETLIRLLYRIVHSVLPFLSLLTKHDRKNVVLFFLLLVRVFEFHIPKRSLLRVWLFSCALVRSLFHSLVMCQNLFIRSLYCSFAQTCCQIDFTTANILDTVYRQLFKNKHIKCSIVHDTPHEKKIDWFLVCLRFRYRYSSGLDYWFSSRLKCSS